jgi:C-22 sterol desaturase
METNATSFVSPLASVQNGNLPIPPQIEYVVDAISNASLWTIAFTILAVLVAYDQSTSIVLRENDE